MALSHRILSTTAITAVTLCILVAPSIGGLTLVSQDGPMSGWSFPSGVSRGGTQSPASMSADGRYIAFITDSQNWDDPYVHGENTVIVLKDMQTEALTLVSTAVAGEPLNGGVDSVSVSADGHYVVFSSWASNIVSNDTNISADVFLFNAWLGTTTRISVTDAGAQANGDNWATSRCISSDGRYVVFNSEATNMTSAGDTNREKDIFVRDLQAQRTYLLSKSTAGVPGNGDSNEPSISPNGRYVTYFSSSDNLVAGTIGQIPRAYVRDMTGNTTTLAAVGALASSSADARYVTYTTLPGTVSSWTQIYVHDMTLGTDRAVSVAPDGVTLGNKDSILSWINDTGRYVVFTSKARNLVTGDTNDESDVFVRDLQTNTTTRLSVGQDGVQGNRSSGYGYPSADGQRVVFTSASEDLVTMDFNEMPDIFMFGPSFNQGFKASDVVSAAAIVGGKKIATSADVANYNVVKTGAGANKVDMADAVRIARMAAGLDTQ